MAWLLSRSRYILILGVIICLVLAFSLLALASIRVAVALAKASVAALDVKTVKDILLVSIETADFLLITTVLYLIAVGLYELFIGKVDLPDWIHIASLDDLKLKLIKVIVIVLNVNFLIAVVNWDGSSDLLILGLGIAVVILAQAGFNFSEQRAGGKKRAGPGGDEG